MRDYRSEAERRRDAEEESPAAAAFAAASQRASRLFGAGKGAPQMTAKSAAKSAGGDAAAPAPRAQPPAEARPAFDAGMSEDAEAALSPGGRRLWTTLLASANGVAERSRRLRARAQDVAIALDRRRDGDAVGVAVLIRVLAGVAFVVVAAMMSSQFGKAFQSLRIEETAALLAAEGASTIAELDPADVAAAEARAVDRVPPVMGVAPADVTGITSLFFLVGLWAIGAALLHYFASGLFGARSNAPIARASRAFGDAIASMLAEIGDSLEQSRSRLQTPGRGASEISRDVSEAHLAAEEAVLLFRDVDFLADDPHGRGWGGAGAVDRYREYLGRVGARPTSRWLEYVTIGVVIGTLFAAFAFPTALFFTLERFFEIPPGEARETISAQLPQSALSKYPTFVTGFAWGLGVFAMAGVLGEAMSRPMNRGRRRVRLGQSLDTVRGAITKAEAPGARDIAMHVEALSAIFQERLAASKPGAAAPSRAAAAGPASADFTGAREGDGWRQDGDAAPRFVEPRFESAPKQWLADDDAGPRRLLGRRASPSKRGFSSFGSGDDR